MNNNKTKDKRVYIRLTEEDLSIIKSKANNAGLSISQYMLDSAKNKNIIYVDGLRDFLTEYAYLLQLHSKYIYELNKVGVNINQLAYQCNQSGMCGNEEIARLATYYAEIEMINNKLDMFIKGYNDVVSNIQNLISDKIG